MAAKKRFAPSPQAFFERSVPRVLDIMRARCAELGGRYTVHVEDSGVWTIDFTRAAVVADTVPGADVVIRLTPAQFASLSTGGTELRKLAVSGQAPFEGDAQKLENVSLVLAFLERG